MVHIDLGGAPNFCVGSPVTVDKLVRSPDQTGFLSAHCFCRAQRERETTETMKILPAWITSIFPNSFLPELTYQSTLEF